MKYTTALPIRSIINARSGEWYYSKIVTKVPNMRGIEYAHVDMFGILHSAAGHSHFIVETSQTLRWSSMSIKRKNIALCYLSSETKNAFR